jgi:energy-coupling factor transporter ATP-binding protein EcfA2
MTDFHFLLKDVNIQITDSIPTLSKVTYEDQFVKLNEKEFTLNVPGIADFYVINGDQIIINPADGARKEDVELYLNGSVLGGILHQRQLMPLHGSSFQINQHGILICGESGAGKSTLTYGLCLKENTTFLTDDITPLSMRDGKCYISAISDKMKLWENVVSHFNLKKSNLQEVRIQTEKYFVEIPEAVGSEAQLDILFFMEKKDVSELIIEAIEGAEKFSTLYKNIYRVEIIDGMKETKLSYFKLLTELSNSIPLYKITRPENSNIEDTVNAIYAFIESTISVKDGQ